MIRQVGARVVFCLREDGYQGCLLIIVHTLFPGWILASNRPINRHVQHAARSAQRLYAHRCPPLATTPLLLAVVPSFFSPFSNACWHRRSQSHERVWCVPDKYGQLSHREAVGAGLAQRQGDGLVSGRSQFDSLLRLSFLF